MREEKKEVVERSVESLFLFRFTLSPSHPKAKKKQQKDHAAPPARDGRPRRPHDGLGKARDRRGGGPGRRGDGDDADGGAAAGDGDGDDVAGDVSADDARRGLLPAAADAAAADAG